MLPKSETNDTQESTRVLLEESKAKGDTKRDDLLEKNGTNWYYRFNSLV